MEVAHGSRRTPAVALSFHGAGDPALARQLLTVAQRAHASVTVLAVGTWLQAFPDMGHLVLSAGHELGNHTLHHFPMGSMDEATAYKEIAGGQHQVSRFTDAPTWFRPSGLTHAPSHVLAAAGKAGYTSTLSFDVDPLDYADPGARVVASRVLQSVKPGSIVSLHLGHAGTVAALPVILAGLRRKGLAPVTVSQLLVGVSP